MESVFNAQLLSLMFIEPFKVKYLELKSSLHFPEFSGYHDLTSLSLVLNFS